MKKLILLGALMLLFFGCLNTGEQINEQGNEKIIIGVTIAPQQEFAEKIGGEKVEVVLMVPPGASPHSYEPTSQQLVKLSDAELYAKVGSGVEFELSWMENIISLNQNMLVVDCSDRVELIKMGEEHSHEEEAEEHEHEESGMDPHIWLSPKNAKIMVENIYFGLIEVDPENKEYYLKNKNNYLEELEELNQKIKSSLENKSNKKFIVYHPAWGYFAHEYGLEQISVEEQGKEPTLKGIQMVVEQANKNNIKVIFASPEFETESAETIAQEINGEVILIDPLEKEYINNLEYVAEVFEENME